MAVITLETLRSRVLARAQMDEDDPGCEDLDGAINSGCKYVRDILRRYRPAGFNIRKTPEPFTTVQGVQTVDLPDAIETLEGVDIQIDGRWYTAWEFDFADRNKLGEERAWSINDEGRLNAFYTILDTAIFFQDPPDGVYTGRFWLSEVHEDLDQASDEVQLWGYEQAAIDFAAMQCMENDDLDTSHLERGLQRWERKIEQLGKRRKRGGHGAARDVTGATANLRPRDRERIP